MDPAHHWNQLAVGDALPPERFLAQVVAAGASFRGGPLCVHRRPHLIAPATVETFRGVARVFHRVIRKVTDLLLEDLAGDATLLRALGLDDDRLALARIDPGYRSASVLARLDSFPSGARPLFLELNAESPAGMAYADALARLFLDDPLAGRFPGLSAMFAADAAVDAILGTWRSWSSGRFTRRPSSQPTRPTAAIVDMREVPTAPEFRLFQRRFVERGIRCLIVDPRDLSFDGERLTAGGERIDLVYRRLLVADMLARPGDCAALLDAYRAGAICMVNSLRTVLLHGKGLFALLHAPVLQPRLSERERAMIRTHVPWTALCGTAPGPLTPRDLLDYARREQASLVSKPRTGHGGRGVILGWDVTAAEWERALASPEPRVLQRRVPEIWRPFPDAREGYALRERLVDLSPFLVRGELAGFLCRLSATAPANVTSGASQVPVFSLPGARP